MSGIRGTPVLLLLLMTFSSWSVKSYALILFQKLEFAKLTNTSTKTSLMHEAMGLYLLSHPVFFAPVLGAFLANTFGPTRVIRAGGHLALIPILVMAYLSHGYLGQHFWSFLLQGLAYFAFSLTDAAVLVLLLECNDCDSADGCDARDRVRSALIQIYFAVRAIGNLIGPMLFIATRSRENCEYLHQKYINLAAWLLFTVCAWCLKSVPPHPRTEWASFRLVWTSRWCRVAIFVLLFVFAMGTSCNNIGTQFLYYTKPAKLRLLYSLLPVIFVWLGNAVASCLLASLASSGWCGISGKSGRRYRMVAGLALQLAVQAAYLVAATVQPKSLTDSPDRAVVHLAVFSLATGAGISLAMGAVFEQLAAAAPAPLRIAPLSTGLAAWDLALVLEALAFGLYFKKKHHEQEFYTNYAVCLALLLVALLQLLAQAFPQAAKMEAVAQDWEFEQRLGGHNSALLQSPDDAERSNLTVQAADEI